MEELNCKKVLKFTVNDYNFFNLFSEVQKWYWKTVKFGLGCFLGEDKVNSILNVFLTMGAVDKDIKSKREFYRQSWS